MTMIPSEVDLDAFQTLKIHTHLWNLASQWLLGIRYNIPDLVALYGVESLGTYLELAMW